MNSSIIFIVVTASSVLLLELLEIPYFIEEGGPFLLSIGCFHSVFLFVSIGALFGFFFLKALVLLYPKINEGSADISLLCFAGLSAIPVVVAEKFLAPAGVYDDTTLNIHKCG